jgi:hypothetical protein
MSIQITECELMRTKDNNYKHILAIIIISGIVLIAFIIIGFMATES